MLNMFNRDLNVNACYENEECYEFAGAAVTGTETGLNTAMMLFNNGYAVTIMDISSMMLQMTTQQPAVSNHDPLEDCVTDTTNDCQDNMLVITSTHIHSDVLPSVNHSVYNYFSSAFEVAT